MAKNQTPKADASQEPTVKAPVVLDVTEKFSAAPSIESGLIEIQPMSALPETHKSLVVSYPSAKGFTEESGSIALHF